MNRAQRIQFLVEFVLSPEASKNAQHSVDAFNTQPLMKAATYASNAVKHYTGVGGGDSEWSYGGIFGRDTSPHEEIIDTAKSAIKGVSQQWNTPRIPPEPSYTTRTPNDIVRRSFPKPQPPSDPGGLSEMPPKDPSGPFPDRP